MAGRTIEMLSTELYSSPTHFIMEVVQNACDNMYASNITPALHFTLQGDRVILWSNELGFSRDNVDSICNMAKSSKNKSDGCIGEKGMPLSHTLSVCCMPTRSGMGVT
jgi:hypothetical protein